MCRDNHATTTCPEEDLPPLVPLPKLDEKDLETLEDVAFEVFGKYIYFKYKSYPYYCLVASLDLLRPGANFNDC